MNIMEEVLQINGLNLICWVELNLPPLMDMSPTRIFPWSTPFPYLYK